VAAGGFFVRDVRSGEAAASIGADFDTLRTPGFKLPIRHDFEWQFASKKLSGSKLQRYTQQAVAMSRRCRAIGIKRAIIGPESRTQ
jgi:hypothetical protein